MAISKKLVKEIKEHVSIVDLAKDYFQVTKKNGYLGIVGSAKDGGDFSSLVIYPETNSFFRQSTRRGGDVISFVQETGIEGISSFKDAVNFLHGRIDPDFKVELVSEKKKDYDEMTKEEKLKKIEQCHEIISSQFVDLNHPRVDDRKRAKIDQNYRNVMAYLIQERKIDPEIVKEGIKKGEIMQITMYGYKSVAFVSKQYGMYSCISRRAITKNSTFKGDFKGCNYDYGWRIFPEPKNGIVLLQPNTKIYAFEGYIDMLSYKTLAKQNGENHSNDIFIVCGSANKYKCIVNAVREYPYDVVICFDNDKAGKELGDTLADKLKDIVKKDGTKIRISKEFSKAKDWNEDLQNLNCNNMNRNNQSLGHENNKYMGRKLGK